MAASSGVKWATVFVAASTVFSSDATVADESAANPRLLPASERKLRRVRTCTGVIKAVRQVGYNDCLAVVASLRRGTAYFSPGNAAAWLPALKIRKGSVLAFDTKAKPRRHRQRKVRRMNVEVRSSHRLCFSMPGPAVKLSAATHAQPALDPTSSPPKSLRIYRQL